MSVKRTRNSPHASAWTLHAGPMPDSAFQRVKSTVVVERLGTDRGGRVRVTALTAQHARKPARASVPKMAAAHETREVFLAPRRERDLVIAKGRVRSIGSDGARTFVDVETEGGVWRMFVDARGAKMFSEVAHEPLIEFAARPVIGEVFWVNGPPKPRPTFAESVERISREDHEILRRLAQ